VQQLLGTPAIPDLFPGEGPLGGVISALAHSSKPIVAFMPCDLTNASSLSVTTTLAALGIHDIAVPVLGGQQQWVHAVFRTTALDLLRKRFEAGARSIHAGVKGLRLVEVTGGEALWYRDADLPSDLR
jgi:molybdopterin-guanine dinucleotide biosynthesis protein A